MRFTIWDLDEVEPELVHLLKGGAEQGCVWLVMRQQIPLTRLVARGALELLPFCDTFREDLNAQVDLQGASTMPRQCSSKAGIFAKNKDLNLFSRRLLELRLYAKLYLQGVTALTS